MTSFFSMYPPFFCIRGDSWKYSTWPKIKIDSKYKKQFTFLFLSFFYFFMTQKIIFFSWGVDQFRRRQKKPTRKNDFIFSYLKSAKGHVAMKKNFLGGQNFFTFFLKNNDFIFFNVPP
jgi:hypothetical protein